MKFYSYSLSAISLIILSGCVTTQDLRTTAPLIDVSSAKTARVVAACITEGWEKSGTFGMPMHVENKILADGFSVIVQYQQVVQLLADVRESETGSTTKFYKPGFVAATRKFQDAVKTCQ